MDAEEGHGKDHTPERPDPAPPPDAEPASDPEPAAYTGSRPEPEPAAVRRHHLIVRVTHWLAFPLIFLMIPSGLQIYRAYPRFGERGGPYLPNPLQDAAIPSVVRLGGWLAGGLNWHFMIMWPLMAAGVVYLGYLLGSGEWRKLFRPRDVPAALEMTKYYLRIRNEHPPQGKHNALQKGAYTFIILLGMLSVLSGLAVWKPVQLSWLTYAFGGFQAARYWHFLAVWLFVGFTIVHVTLVFVADPASLRAMLTGWYRGRFRDEA
jgi:thiosulfate reductase cytochrome b subunit